LPFTPYAKDVLAKHMARNSKDNPEASCLPMGIMRSGRRDFHAVRPDAGADRHPLRGSSGHPSDLHGRAAAAAEKRSAAVVLRLLERKWEGDTLVVQTNNLRDDGWLDIIGTPLTDEATLPSASGA